MIESTDPDAGKVEMKYSSDGKLRFSQNALQKLTNKFSYINYDSYGRSIESGEITPSGALAFGNVSTAVLDAVGTAASSYLTGTRTDITVINYDNPESIPGVAGYVQDSYFLSGSTVSNKAKYSADPATASNLVTKTWYNYDGDGNVVWTVKYVAGLGYKTMDYVYDDLGNVTKSIYQKGTAAETMVHYFEYERNKRLVASYTNTTDNSSTKILHAKYSYYLHGPLKRVELGDKLQGIDYVYGIDGKLKSINNANAAKDPGMDGGNGFAADVFGMNMEYYAGDYSNHQAGIPTIQNGVSTANYSGLINGISWFSRKPNSTDVAPVMNSYSYDAIGQLTESRWGAPNFTGSSFVSGGEINRERGLSYDSHGNIKTLIRTNGAGGELGNYTYNYQANSNKLTSVTGYATYTYDAVGQLASQIKGNAGMYLDYDVSGKVTKIYGDAAKQTIILSFVYDDDGNRVMKKDHRTGAVTWYSYDGSGTLAAIFEQQGVGAVQLKEQPLYGSDRLGTFYRLGNNYQYTITDHVGNTRVVINRNKTASGAADIVYYADYYPFGMEVRSGGVESRYGYQGLYAEKDKETGWNNFELRNYDAAIGRWLTTDPYGQYHSPYVGMGNNPVSGFDVDGGWTWLTAAWKRMGSLIRGENPGPLEKRYEEWGFYYSKAGNSTGNYAEVIGGKNFGPNRFVNEFTQYMVDNSWKPTNDHLVKYNTITNQLRWTGSGAIKPVYIEFEIALTAYSGGQYLAAKQAAKGVGNSSNVLLNTSRQLKAKFKHASDFGVVGNYNKVNAAKFSSALNQHINASGTQIIQGAYRNSNNPVTFYLNPKTGLNVIASPSGQFISGAALCPVQVQGILTKGFLW